MGNLFNPDALLWRWCSRILDVMVLSILWFFCSLPAVTAGAASAALYDAAVHGIRRDEPGAYARFLRTFRRELKTGCLASLLWGAVIAAPLWGGTQIGRTIQEPGPVLAAAAVIAALLFFALGTACWMFPLLSRFEFSLGGLLRTAIQFFIVHLPSSLLLTLLLGARSIERSNKVMMPLFFIIFLILAVRVAFLPGAVEGYKYMFTPRWDDLLNPMVWIWAMGQAFFSLSITGSGMIVYGAYLSPEEDVVALAKQTALFDTVAALVAALVIIPACFAYGLDVGSGPSLLFVTLPHILQDIPLGRLFAVILYTAMVFAGVSSLQNMFEAVGESLLHRFPRLNRKVMLAIPCVICLGIGVNMEPIFKWGPWMDIVSIYIIPIGATLGALSWFWIMKREELMEEINRGAKKPSGQGWYSVGRYLYVPCAIILCCVALFLKVAF